MKNVERNSLVAPGKTYSVTIPEYQVEPGFPDCHTIEIIHTKPDGYKNVMRTFVHADSVKDLMDVHGENAVAVILKEMVLSYEEDLYGEAGFDREKLEEFRQELRSGYEKEI